MVSIQTFVSNVNSIYNKKPVYKLGCDGNGGKCDCIGMVRGALEMANASTNGLSGTNYAARYTIKNFKKIKSVSDLKVGDVVVKGRPYDKNDSYPLPEKYLPGGSKYNGDTTNYYHIGTVTNINPLEITHMTSPTAKKDVKLGNWNYYGQLPQVSYTKDEVIVVVEYATVTGGSLNLRSAKSVTSTKITVIPSGSKVAVTEHSSDWSKIMFNSFTGYVMTKYLKFESDGDKTDTITISLTRDNAMALYEALKLSLKL